MIRPFLIFGATCIAFAGAPAVAAPLGDSDKTALEQLAATNDAAWGSKDVATMSGQYASDGTVRVSPQAPVISGKASVAKFFSEAFARREGVHRHITNLDHIELLTPDMALADASVRVERQLPDGSWSLVRTFRNLSVAVREAGGWKLRSVRAIPQN